MILQKEGANELVVDYHGSVGWNWKEAPDKEAYFDQPVEWEPTEDDIRKELNSGKQCIDNPISQPLGIVLFVWGLQSMDWAVGRVDESDKVTD